jgi:hypothetical protein
MDSLKLRYKRNKNGRIRKRVFVNRRYTGSMGTRKFRVYARYRRNSYFNRFKCFSDKGLIMTYRQLIEAALVAVIDAVENPDSDAGLASAERACALLKTYLYEVDTCTQ